MSEQNKAALEQVIEAINRHDIEEAMRVLSRRLTMLKKRIPIRALSLAMRICLAVLSVTGLAIAASPAVLASNHVETVVVFDPAASELPEGVAVDKTGNVFVSLAHLGQLVKVEPGSNTYELFGSIQGLGIGDIGLIGLAIDAPGNVYGAVVAFTNPDAHGVWKFDRKTGAGQRVVGTEAIWLPNAIAFDKRGTMYVTDTILGAVWRVPKNGSAELWIQDPLLEGDGSAGFGIPLGANGIAVRHNTVYVGVTEKASIVTVPILPDGSAGTATVWAQLQDAVDGIALDVHGNVYIAATGKNEVQRVNLDSTIDVLATVADGLDAPSSIAFGMGKGDRQSLYAVNYSLAVHPPPPVGAGPALLKIDVGVPGLPTP